MSSRQKGSVLLVSLHVPKSDIIVEVKKKKSIVMVEKVKLTFPYLHFLL